MTTLIRSIPEVHATEAAVKGFGGWAATTPGRLRLWAAGVWVCAILFGWITQVAIDRHRREMQTIGKDSAPSIIAAQTIKWNIADLHGDVVLQYLGTPAEAADAERLARLRRTKVTDGLLTAAQNITYGDAERVPIGNLLDSLSDYDGAVARAGVRRDKDRPAAIASLRTADQIVHDRLYPAADALDKANREALDRGYTDEQAASGWATAVFVAMALAMTGILAGAQLGIRRRTHRHLSPMLVAATLLTIAWAANIFTALRAESHELKVVKQDCYDSIIALWQARADGTDAQANLGLAVLDPESADAAGKLFDRETANLAKLSNGQTFESLTPQVERGEIPDSFTGYIATELRNITFDGEKEAADAMFNGFARYVAAAGEVRVLDGRADHDAAVRQCLGVLPDQARGAFDSFDHSLEKTLQINQDEFDRAVERGFADVGGFTFWNVLVVLAVAGLAQWGISRRLAEYRR
jgi:hypothetical protein